MKFKILVGSAALSAMLLVGACGGNHNTGTNNANNTAVVTTPTPIPKTSETAATDPAMKTRIEDALKKKGFTDVTVDTTTTPMTVRGTAAKGKEAELMATVQENNGAKPINNQVTFK